MNEKFFETMKPLQSRITNLYNIGVIAICPDYVQVTDNLFAEIIKGRSNELKVYFNKLYPEAGAEIEASIEINSVKYITIGSEKEFMEVGIPVSERE